MSDRDELARELFIADNANQPREQSIVDWQWFNDTPRFRGRIEHYNAMASGILAAGYGKLTDAWDAGVQRGCELAAWAIGKQPERERPDTTSPYGGQQ